MSRSRFRWRRWFVRIISIALVAVLLGAAARPLLDPSLVGLIGVSPSFAHSSLQRCVPKKDSKPASPRSVWPNRRSPLHTVTSVYS
jgi:hypothetical protein